MIDYFVGTVKEAQEQEIILDLGMIGLTLHVPSSHHFLKGSIVTLYSYLHWNAENGPSLFGFAQILDRSIFRLIISCSGIGPKIALAILADLGAQGFLHAISSGDDQMLSRVNGIGKKKAEQIIVQLKHKVAALLEAGTVDMGELQESSHFHDVNLALQSLNYSRSEISRAMDYLKKNAKAAKGTFDVLLRQALSYLSKQV